MLRPAPCPENRVRYTHALNGAGHLLDGVQSPDVVLSGEFVHVPLQVLRRHPVIDALWPRLSMDQKLSTPSHGQLRGKGWPC